MKFVHALASLPLLFALGTAGCAADTQVTDDSTDTSEDNLTASKSCGANYAKANALYTEAVKLSKKYNADRCADDNISQGLIVTKMQSAITTCEAFRAVYTKSPWAAPARKALAGNIEDGLLRGKGPVDALAGSTFWSRKPGAIQPSLVAFGTDGKAKLTSYVTPGKEGTPVSTTVSYSISQPRCLPSSSCPILFVSYGNGDVQKLMKADGEYVLVDEDFDLTVNASQLFTSPSVSSNYEDICSA